MDLEIEKIINWYTGQTEISSDLICETRDVFSARSEKWFRSLMTTGIPADVAYLRLAIIGEIGNNSFDHNLGKWQSKPGLAFFANEKVAVLVDRGQGVVQSLKSAGIQLPSTEDYLDLAFTKTISGRSPEKRGNGLKLVKNILFRLNASLLFKTKESCYELNSHNFSVVKKLLDQKPNDGVFVYIYF